MRLFVAVVGVFLLSSCVDKKGSVPGPAVVEWGSPEGVKRLERSNAKGDFFKLANQFQSQQNKFFCGPTSAAMVLNAFRLGREDLPEDKTTLNKAYVKYSPKDFDPFFHRYTQNGFFNAQTEAIRPVAKICGEPKEGKSGFGIGLRDFAKMLEVHGLKVALHIAENPLPAETIRQELIANLKDPADFAIVNYSRKSLNQKGGGHISPLGAYDEKSDSFLILDVNPNTSPWVWVTSDALIAAMKTGDGGVNRGYLFVRD